MDPNFLNPIAEPAVKGNAMMLGVMLMNVFAWLSPKSRVVRTALLDNISAERFDEGERRGDEDAVRLRAVIQAAIEKRSSLLSHRSHNFSLCCEIRGFKTFHSHVRADLCCPVRLYTSPMRPIGDGLASLRPSPNASAMPP